MPTVQNLRKKLRGIRTTQKIAKAMKTASTIKFSRLNGSFAEYSRYSSQYKRLYEARRDKYDSFFNPADASAPECLIVMASNKGMCGAFNTDLLRFAAQRLESSEREPVVFLCGKKAIDFFEEKRIPYERSFIFKDIPEYAEAQELFSAISEYFEGGKISSVRIIYPKYVNMLIQKPEEFELLARSEQAKKSKSRGMLYPDEDTFIKATAKPIMEAFIFEKILECALGAQASTLMTMRAAYDNASEYSAQLESDINRKRQSQVTSDVIETSSERSQKEI